MNYLVKSMLAATLFMVVVITVVLSVVLIDVYEESDWVQVTSRQPQDRSDVSSSLPPLATGESQEEMSALFDDSAESTNSDVSVSAANAVADAVVVNVQSPPAAYEAPPSAAVNVTVDIAENVHPISPLIYGLSGADFDYATSLGVTMNSWGGNPSSRYNWRIGHAWNAARDYEYRNGNYGGEQGVSYSDLFIRNGMENNMVTRLAVPTLGWVAKDDNLDTCSFPNPDGSCGYGEYADCRNPLRVTDPTLTSVPSTPEDIREWMQHLRNSGLHPDFIAMDNEPELWGSTHYDVHPDCTTYKEMLDKYLSYAKVVREEMPDAQLTGPTTCCWTYYWNSPAGKIDKVRNGGEDFLPWFLKNVREFDEQMGVRHLDVFDIHFYPLGLYDVEYDQRTALHRLRATSNLWDPNFVDEAYPDGPVYLIPRMKALIDEHYPGTKFAISEWNFGADDTMNGAIAIADVLGIFGREDVYFANYWMFPELGTPGYNAFKLYTNYDNNGSKFGDVSVSAENNDPWIASFASVDSETDKLHIIVINKHPASSAETLIEYEGFNASSGQLFRYAEEDANTIVTQAFEPGANWSLLDLSSSSITHLILDRE